MELSEINLTLPFTGSIFGTDNATNAFASEKYGLSDSTPKFWIADKAAISTSTSFTKAQLPTGL